MAITQLPSTDDAMLTELLKSTALSPQISRMRLWTVILASIAIPVLVFFWFHFITSQTHYYFVATRTTLDKQSSNISTCFTARFSSDSILQARDMPFSKWAMDSGHTMRYVGDGRTFALDNHTFGKLYRTYTGYQQCLANKHVVFVGDSRVRYQYMTLVSFLSTGEWPRCGDYQDVYTSMNMTLNSTSDCFLIDYGYSSKIMTWNDWYASSSAWVNDECDCSRAPHFQPATTFENRFFHKTTSYGTIRVTYLQNFQDSIKFHKDFPPLSRWNGDKDIAERNETDSPRCEAGFCSGPPDLNLSTSKALLEMVPKLQPTHLFANTGWKHDEGNTPERFGCVLEKFRIENPQVLAYAVSQPWLQGAAPSAVPAHGCNTFVYDRLAPTIGVPRSWYWDKMHSLSIVNQEFNHMLLDIVCDPLESQSMCATNDA